MLISPSWRDVSDDFDPAKVISTFQEFAPWRLVEVEKARQNKGLSSAWLKMRPKRLVDLILGLDSVFYPTGVNNPLMGLDVTLNPEELVRKENKKKKISASGAYSALGVEKIGILHIIPSFHLPEEGWWEFMTDSQKREFSYLLEEEVYLIDEADEPVSVRTIKF